MAKTALALACLAAVLGGCGSVPDRPAPPRGQSIDSVIGDKKGAPNRPAFLFEANGHRLALYGVDPTGALDPSGARSVSMLAFEDNRFLGKLSADTALRHSNCLAQRGGRIILAQRLRTLAATAPDSLSGPKTEVDAAALDALCPPGPEGTPPPPPTATASEEPVTVGDAVAGILAYSALLVVGIATLPITLPLAAGMAVGGQISDQPSLEAQERLELNMDVEAVAALMGQPSARFCLEPVGSEVQLFERSIAPRLWIGFENGRVTWLRTGSPERWLDAVAEKLRKSGGACP